MYPEWPKSDADLVPLPHCEGPKLKPFDFQGPQKIEFLEHIGDGLHSHVFKVAILGSVYALKLFRFVDNIDWASSTDFDHDDNIELWSPFYHYSEPFNAECRAFGRLQEAGEEELAVKCFGYLLLDEEHERAMIDKFKDVKYLDLDFNGNGINPGYYDIRSIFVGRDGRPAPLRGIVKAFGRSEEPLRTRDAKKILRDVIRIQQLGIFSIDVAHKQLINGKIADFSTAMTVPHYLTNPEMNPHLTPEWIRAMEFETFRFSLTDFWDFDTMVRDWNYDHKDKIRVTALPSGRGCRIKYDLRPRPSVGRVYSLVDPRRYDWRNPVTTSVGAAARGAANGRRSGQEAKGSSPGKPKGAISKTRRRLDARPPRWYFDVDSDRVAHLRKATSFCTEILWEFKDGLIFPQKKD